MYFTQAIICFFERVQPHYFLLTFYTLFRAWSSGYCSIRFESVHSYRHFLFKMVISLGSDKPQFNPTQNHLSTVTCTPLQSLLIVFTCRHVDDCQTRILLWFFRFIFFICSESLYFYTHTAVVNELSFHEEIVGSFRIASNCVFMT